MTRCSWCNTDAEEAAGRHEGPHLTWCVHFREEQRGARIFPIKGGALYLAPGHYKIEVIDGETVVTPTDPST